MADDETISVQAQLGDLAFDRSAYLHAILTTLPDAVAVVDSDTRLRELNPAALELIGMAELPGNADLSPLSVVALRSLATLRKHVRSALAPDYSKAASPHIVHLKTVQGIERTLECRLAPLCNADGVTSGVIISARDVTEKEEILQDYASGAAILEAILATVPDAMVVSDAQGRIILFSAAAEAMFGYTSDEVIGRNVRLLMPDQYSAEHDHFMGDYLQTGERRIIGIGRVVEAKRRDGSCFPVELAVGEAITGDHHAFTAFMRDLSEQQATEAQLRELQSELIHASRLSAVGTLASALAHELNQPLTAIANYLSAGSDLIHGQGGNETEQAAQLRSALDEASKEALRAGQIVRRLRDFIARGEVDRRRLSLSAIVAAASTIGLVGAKEAGIVSRISIDPAGDLVLADRIQVQQVLVNLMRNAIEAMEDSPVKQLNITARPISADLVEVCVSDTGPGFDPEFAEQLFQPFVSTKSRGMGLGLSICRTIVEANGGKLDAEAGRRGGARFCFTLMRAQGELFDD